MKIFIADFNGMPLTVTFVSGVITTTCNGVSASIGDLAQLIPILRVQPRKRTEEFITAFAESFTEKFSEYNEEVAEDIGNFLTNALIAEIYA